MIGFLIKKAFFDMWDNMFRIILMNLGFLAILAVFFLLAPWLGGIAGAGNFLLIATLVFGVALLSIYCGAVSRMTSEIADYKQPGFVDFYAYAKESLPTSLLFALVLILYAFVLQVAFPFYWGIKSLIGLLAASLLFWVSLALVLSSQYFFPIQSRLDKRFPKMLRKMLLLFFDNTLFTVGLLLGALAVTGASLFTAFLLPGISCVFLWWNVALKLRLLKYDWIEQNPEEKRKHVPWDALLLDDRERVGKRTLKGMIFPWKE
jgi:hypothetical protein